MVAALPNPFLSSAKGVACESNFDSGHKFVITPRASDWNLASPNWRGRMRIVTKGDKCFVKLEDKHSG